MLKSSGCWISLIPVVMSAGDAESKCILPPGKKAVRKDHRLIKCQEIAHQRSHELELFDSLLSETRYVGEIGLDGGKGFKEH